MNAPDGYEAAAEGSAWVFALPGSMPWLKGILGCGGTLHGWAAAHPGRRALMGRGPVHSVPAPGSGGERGDRWVVRHYLRGGLVARWLEDRYLALGEPRPLREARASAEARRLGVPTPPVMAGAVYRAGLFYRADLVTGQIPDSEDLAAVLSGTVGAPTALDRDAAMYQAGALVRRLEEAGFFHPDMNAKNVVIQAHAGGPRAHLVDLDGCSARPGRASTPGHIMRRRLERSLRKLERQAGVQLPTGAWAALRQGFQAP